jgi:hypothetical protein
MVTKRARSCRISATSSGHDARIGSAMEYAIMTKKLLLGSAAAVLTLALIGGSIALAQGPRHGHGFGGWEAGWGGGGMPGARMIERFDRNGDGQVSQADVDAVRAERLATFDADGNGVLSLAEYEALWLDAMRPRMVRGFQRLDVDGDAGVTEVEFLAPYARLVQRVDGDGDGVITEDEIRAQMRERRSAMRGRQGGRMGDGWGMGDGRDPRGPVD